MRTFSIDIASHQGHFACVDDHHVLSTEPVGRVQDTELIPLLESVLKHAGWIPKDIERIACNLGPGGFTSVRSGVVFANTLADELRLPIAGYRGDRLMAARADVGAGHAPPRRQSFLWVHSTRSDRVFVRGGDWTEPIEASLAEVVSTIRPGTTVVGDCMETHRAELEKAGAEFPALRPLEEMLPAFVDGLTYAKTMLVPWYGRGI